MRILINAKTRLACLLLLVLMAAPLTSMADDAVAGRIFFVSGGVYIDRAGTHLPALNEEVLQSGDILVTESDGRVQWRMSDDSYYVMRPDSHFKVDDFEAQGSEGAPANGKSLYILQTGGFRTIDGLIGKGSDASSYQVTTPVATMGVRGTDYTAVVCQNDCGWASKKGGAAVANGLYARVDVGSIVITNKGGELEVKAGQYVFVADQNTIPAILTAIPAVFTSWHEDFVFKFGKYVKEIDRRIEPLCMDPSPSAPCHKLQ